MPFTTEHLQISWLFSVEGTPEVADTGLKAGVVPTFDAVAALGQITQTKLTSLFGHMQTMLQTTPFVWADYSRLESVKVAAIDTAGHYLTDPIISTTASVLSGGSQVPAQLTVVGSIRSGTKTGQANYGRMYLPHTRLALETGSALVSSTVTAAASAVFNSFLIAVRTTLNSGTAPCTPLLYSAQGAGTTKAPHFTSVDNVIDTQRRRLNRLPHVPVILAYP